ncbi:TniQ family protein [Fredinandcohnia sp. FSL W7-1320]|uniref:TniQ family protein n=1 Tax=Fredinandcohnia sp. FSL W7-1320 TaxID=2954540 RepID=UPI0030FDCED0
MQNEIYETLEITPTELTDRSDCFALNPMGVGTPFVENLTSYINRLARAHNIRSSDFLRYKVSEFLKSAYLISELNNGGLNNKCRYINSDSSVAKEFVGAIEYLVGKDNLLYLTLLPFSSSYYISTKGIIKQQREWCPLCYREQEKKYETTFDLLLWTIVGVKVCLLHKTKLMSNCGNCGTKFRVIMKDSTTNLCHNCGMKLDQYVDRNPCTEWEVYYAEKMGELISSMIGLSRNKEIFLENLKKVVSHYKYYTAAAKATSISETTLRSWIIQKQIPNIIYLLRFCFATNINPINLLNNELDMSKFNPRQQLPEFNEKLVMKRGENEKYKELLTTIIKEDAFPPPSLSEVERRLNNRGLRRNFPDLCKKIVDRHKLYLKNKKNENDRLKYNEIYKIGKELYELGIYPSWQSIAEKSEKFSLNSFKSSTAYKAREDLFNDFNISKSINQYVPVPNLINLKHEK